MTAAHRSFVSLGSNLGDRWAMLRLGVEGLAEVGQVEAVSPVYETEPWGGVDQEAFLNLVVDLRTDLSPFALLEAAQALEARAERVRRVRWGPRTLDVDLLTYDDLVLYHARLELPHPRMGERRFVLQPLADLDPDLVDPDQLAAAVGEVTAVGML